MCKIPVGSPWGTLSNQITEIESELSKTTKRIEMLEGKAPAASASASAASAASSNKGFLVTLTCTIFAFIYYCAWNMLGAPGIKPTQEIILMMSCTIILPVACVLLVCWANNAFEK
ncbi:hypothetical protein BCR34DRAFT_604713 [Clohesyomyces aquaticus]|uniref:Uncharacterized protein n=1 Tax=Clohesyomyces aquaticus TaxID=1231657 RepID=A0A1Y1Z3N2_9PLEO|nr:hypothetical protein BCR34DRAFT_604713 [Clohesyomyces aquaticus]